MRSETPIEIPDEWERDEALRVLMAIAVEIPTLDVDELEQRLGRLTETQRAVITHAIANVMGA